MDNTALQPYKVIEMIEYLNGNFSEIYNKYLNNIAKQYGITNYTYLNYDPVQYYMNSHCNSYADILCSIYKENAIKYNNSNHIIVKIGDFFYDVRGMVDLIDDVSSYHISLEEDLHLINICLTDKDYLEKYIENDLIILGEEKNNNMVMKKTFRLTSKVFLNLELKFHNNLFC